MRHAAPPMAAGAALRRPPPHAGLARPVVPSFHPRSVPSATRRFADRPRDDVTRTTSSAPGISDTPFATFQPTAMPSGPKPTRPTAAARIATRFAPREPDQRRTQGAWPASSRASPRNSFDPCARRPAAPDLAAPAAKGERHGKAYGGRRFSFLYMRGVRPVRLARDSEVLSLTILAGRWPRQRPHQTARRRRRRRRRPASLAPRDRRRNVVAPAWMSRSAQHRSRRVSHQLRHAVRHDRPHGTRRRSLPSTCSNVL